MRLGALSVTEIFYSYEIKSIIFFAEIIKSGRIAQVTVILPQHPNLIFLPTSCSLQAIIVTTQGITI
jgi:hypothetical protein